MKNNKTKRILSVPLTLCIVLTLLAAFPATTVSAAEITSCSVTVTVPAAGANPNYTAVSGDPSKYTVSIVRWYDGGTATNPGTIMDSSDTFVGGQTYIVEVLGTPTAGNTFANPNSASYTINGINAVVYDVYSNNGATESRIFRVALTTAGEVTPQPAEPITSCSVTVTAPAAGAKPNYTAVSGDPNKYTVSNFRWFDGGTVNAPGAQMDSFDTFVGGQTYIVEVLGTLTAGNTFASMNTDSVTCTINGISAAVYSVYSNNAISTNSRFFRVAFTATGGQATYTVTVSNGTGGGDYAKDEIVTITADNPLAGQEFDKWTTSDGVVFVNPNMASTTFKMPAKNVAVKANYKDLPPDKYTVIVVNNGGGTANADANSAEKGKKITLTAMPNSGYQFKEWQVLSGGATLVKTDSATTAFTMPDETVIIMACFEAIPDDEPDDEPDEPLPPWTNPFTDVKESDWFYNDVKFACQKGLINGKTLTTYAPNDNLTYAEAVKLAACMHQLSATGKVTLANGTANWYDTYVDYAKQNGIISKDYSWNTPATRAGYMGIFANALSDNALAAINSVPDGSIPDVAMTHPQAAAIYKLYRAGILQGVDSAHNCNPSSNIKRSEVAAILTRMMNPNARVIFSTSISAAPNPSDSTSLTFTHSPSFDIPGGGRYTRIIQINVSGGVSGGTTPYAYSIISGPSWLEISNSGVLSGERQAPADATTAVIQVKDATGETAAITISVGMVK